MTRPAAGSPRPAAGSRGWATLGALSEPRKLSVAGWVAVVATLGGFLFKLSFRAMREVNGVQVECSYFDLGPFVVAVVCLVAGIKCLGNRNAENRSLSLETGSAVIGLAGAAVHVLRGVLITAGALGPCALPRAPAGVYPSADRLGTTTGRGAVW